MSSPRFELNPPLADVYEPLLGPEKKHEDCGVAAVLVPYDTNIAVALANGLKAEQHRGQEAAGVAVCMADENAIMVFKGLGEVQEVMGGAQLKGMPDSQMGIAHARFSTFDDISEEKRYEASGPELVITRQGTSLTAASNGPFNNLIELADKHGVEHQKDTTDTHLVTEIVASEISNGSDFVTAAINVLSQADGAFSMVMAYDGQMIVVRDPYGFRPLMMGSYPNGGWAWASETPAIEAMGATFRREVARGEMIVGTSDGAIESLFPFDERPSRLCAFEFVYFSAPNGELNDRSVHVVRKRMGEILAEESPVPDADVVIGIPDSGTSAAEGFAQQSGLPKVSGIIKNRYLTKRTFIMPSPVERSNAVRQKLHPITAEIFGRSVVVVDDSIVRGTTSKEYIKMLWENGASEVHLRIPSAPYRWPCFYGMNTRDANTLLARNYPTVEEMADYLGVTSLAFLSVEGIRRAAAADAAHKLCMACMDGNYPTYPQGVPVDLRREANLPDPD